MDFVWDGLIDILFGWIFDLLYLMQSGICTVIDFIVETFYKLSGLESVKVDGKETDLLTHFIETPAVRTAFLGVFLVGVILLCIFVLVAIIRSEYADQQHKKTKGQILVKAGQSFIIFLIIPLLLAAGILLTNTVMSAVNGSMLAGVTTTGRPSFGGQILVTSGYNAYTGSAGARAEIERKFISGELDYTNLGVVKQYYDLWHVNYFVGIFSGLILVILFALAALRFVQRIFDVILLYVISPASVATIPVDDGARFKLWREMLVSKVLSAYGIIFAMNLFFLIVPQVSRIQFYSGGFQNSLIGLLFIIGGAFAVTKAYMVIAQLTGSNAGAQEAQQTMAGIYSGIRMARGTMRLASGAIGQVIGGSDFRSNQRKGMGFGENLNSSIHSTRNQRVVGDNTGRKGKDDDKEKKNGGASANGSQGGGGGNNGGGQGGGSSQGAQTVRENNRSSQSADSRQYRGADNNAHSHTDGGQSVFADSDNQQSHSADRENVQTHTDGGQNSFTDYDSRQSHSADRETAQPQDGSGQGVFADSDSRQFRNTDSGNANSDTGGVQNSSADISDRRGSDNNAQTPIMNSNNRQPYGAYSGNAQTDTNGGQTPFADYGGRQPSGGTDSTAQTGIGGAQAPRVGTDSLPVKFDGKDIGQPTTDGAQPTIGSADGSEREKMTAGQKTAHFFGGVMRLSNLPVGFVKDLFQGGVIAAGKNAWPRIRNVVTGRGIINHADVKAKPIKDGNPTNVQTGGAINQSANTAKPEQAKPDKKDKKGGKK